MTTKTILSVLVAAAVMTAGAPFAAAERIDLSVGPATRWMSSASVDPISDRDSSAFVSTVLGVRVAKVDAGPWVTAEVSYDHGGLSGDLFSSLDTRLSLDTVTAGLKISQPLFTAVSAFARGGMGLAHGHLAMSSVARPDMSASDGDWGGTTFAAVGLEARSTTLVQVGFRAEVGYAKGQSLSFDAARERDDDDVLHIPTAGAAMGELDTDGVTLRFALVLAY
ncbi:MAG TPA: hypothetical protein VFG83_04365 [Kofleriaceae bacterium]|nr:hypothetical protein [Kofleriaceae bacterium]